MGKIIKLKEADLRNIVAKILAEQINPPGTPAADNPLAAIKPSTNRPMENPGMPAVGGNEIVKKKIAVRVGLKKLVFLINDLIVSSGINPETNNLVADIEKVQEKFENLWGDPTPETEGDE
jgi:hypothetical protein